MAHRGASGHELENSMASFKKAVELGADVIEADIQLTRDDVPIVFHDKLLDRTSNASGYTTDFTWSEFESGIRLKNGEKVPTLEEYCLQIKSLKQLLYLDLKVFGTEGLILRTCQKFLNNDQFYFGSFHNHSIRLAKQFDPGITTVMIIEGNPIDMSLVVQNARCDIVAMGFDSIEEDSIPLVQEMDKMVFTWTVDDPREIARAKSLGVNGITSNFVDRI
ncbi:MAG: glycerophosphodiester phosphodiesterase [Vicingaceae bacterium]